MSRYICRPQLIMYQSESRRIQRGVGLDFGTHDAVAFSDGKIIDNPRFIKQSQEKVNQLARKGRRKRAPNYGRVLGEKFLTQKPTWKKQIRPSRRWKKANQSVPRYSPK